MISMVKMHTSTIAQPIFMFIYFQIILTRYILSASTEFSLTNVVNMYNTNTQKRKSHEQSFKKELREAFASKQYRRVIAHDYQDKQNGK